MGTDHRKKEGENEGRRVTTVDSRLAGKHSDVISEEVERHGSYLIQNSVNKEGYYHRSAQNNAHIQQKKHNLPHTKNGRNSET